MCFTSCQMKTHIQTTPYTNYTFVDLVCIVVCICTPFYVCALHFHKLAEALLKTKVQGVSVTITTFASLIFLIGKEEEKSAQSLKDTLRQQKYEALSSSFCGM